MADKPVKARIVGVDAQPVATVHWVYRDELHSNTYNPNRVASPEMRLLKQSLLEDGWTQPIVARRDGEIVDGFHRWTLTEDPDIDAMTGGLIPVVYLDADTDMASQMMSTIRHNRARGQHLILPMADIVGTLIDEHGLTPVELKIRLSMEDEEVDRLFDRSGMPTRAGDQEFGKSWSPER